VEWLNGECFIRGNYNVGSCVFADTIRSNTSYIAFVVPFLFYSRVKLNQLSPLVSVTSLTLALFNNPPFVGNFIFCMDLIGFPRSPLSIPRGRETFDNSYTFLYDTHFFMIIISQPKEA